MPLDVRPATHFADVATILGPRRPDANVCWCLSYRLPSKQNVALRGTQRADTFAELMASGTPGVLAYDGGEVVGWAAVHPRANTSFAVNRKIPHVDDLDVWSTWCIQFARQSDAPAIEGYPVDNGGQKVDLTMAYVGTRAMFERAGFVKASDTASVINGHPRVLMRFDLR